MRGDGAPPAWLRRALGRLLPPGDRSFELGEMDALYRRRVRDRGSARADLWYAGEVLRFAWGMTADAARRTRMRSGVWSRGVWIDVRHGIRALSRSSSYALVIALTLGVGIGANGTVYALANWVLLRPVPGVTDPDGLVTMRLQVDGYVDRIANLDFEDLAGTIPSLSALAATSAIDVHVATVSGARRVRGELVSATYFDVLAVPLQGRGFLDDEGRTPGVRSVVISEQLAKALLPEPAVGATIHVNGQPYSVVGVALDGFRGVDLPGTNDAWFPAGSFVEVLSWLHPEALTQRGETVWERLLGRRAPGAASTEEVEAEANAALDELRDEVRNGRALTAEQRLRVYSGIGLPHGVRGQVSRTLRLMGAAALLLLLLAAANTANVALARAMLRREQSVVRRALGASRWRLARESLVENVLLGGVGGVVGTTLTLTGILLFRGARLTEDGTLLEGAVLDVRVFAFLAAASIASGLLFGAVPASFAARFAPVSVLRESRGTTSGRRARSILVVAQFALSVTLMIGAVQLARTIHNIQRVDLGVDTRDVVLASIEPGIQRHQGDRSRELLTGLLPALRSVPAVEAAGLISLRPYSASYYPGVVTIPGDEETRVVARAYRVSDRLLGLLGVELLEGRDFTTAEVNGEAAEPVVILNAAAAKRIFPRGDALGRVILRYGRPTRVVAIAEDARLHAVLEPAAEYLFEPLLQPGPTSEVTLVVRSAAGLAASAEALGAAVARFDPDLPLYEVGTLQSHIDRLSGDRRTAARLGIVVALLGALLAAVGLYGSLATALAERQRELGIRLIVGADPRVLSAAVVRYGFTLGMIGAAIGVFGGILLARAMGSLLWGVGRFDAAAASVAFALAAGLAALSSIQPARRILKADPLAAIRD